MSLRVVFRLAVVASVLNLATGTRGALPERKVFQFGEFTIEASAGDEAYVEALALRLVDSKLPPPEPLVVKPSVDDLDRNREQFLGHLAGYLALPKATDTMAAEYDSLVKTGKVPAAIVPTEMPRHYSLWRREELQARIAAGEKIVGIGDGNPGQLGFSFTFSPIPASDAREEKNPWAGMADAWNRIVCPIIVGDPAGRTPAEDVAAGLDTVVKAFFTRYCDELLELQRRNVFAVLRETTETGIFSTYLGSPDRRWFCDGVANYLAWKVIAADVGAEAARGFYDLPAELARAGAEAARVDLAAWPSADDPAAAKFSPGQDSANSAFATKVIADLCARQGDGFLPALFREIGKTKREKATINTVYKACRKLTGENLRALLPKPVVGRQ